MTVVRTGLSTVESARRERVEPTGGITATNAQKALEALDTGTLKALTFTMPAVWTVTGSPTSGNTPTIAIDLATQAANLLWAGPSSGVAAKPTFRAMVAADFQTLSPTWTGNHTFNPTSGDAITVNTAALSTAKAFSVTQSTPTSGTIAGPFALNLFNLTYSMRVTGSGTDSFGLNNVGAVGFRVNQTITSAGVAGTSAPIITGLFAAAVSTTTAITDVTGLAGTAYTNVAASISGFLEGINGVAIVGASGSGVNVLVGGDFGASILTGGSANYRFGLNCASLGNVQGTTNDAAIALMGTGGGAVGWKNGILLTNASGAMPISTTGSLIKSDTATTIANILDLGNITVSGNIAAFPFMGVSGAGKAIFGAPIGSLAATYNLEVTAPSSGVAGFGVSTNTVTGNSFVNVQDSSGNNVLFQAANEAARTGTIFGVTPGNYAQIASSGSTNLGLLFGTATNVPIIIGTNNTARMRVTGAGLVNIGTDVAPATGSALTINKNTASPLAAITAIPLVHAAGTDSTQPAVLLDSYAGANAGNQGFFTIRKGRGTAAACTPVQSGDALGYFGMVGANANGAFASEVGAVGGIFFGAAATQAWSLTQAGCELRLYTTPNGSTTITQAVTVQQSGGLSVGSTTDGGIGTILANVGFRVGANQVVGARITGYTAMTGSPDKATAYATGSVTLPQLAGRVAQLQADLTTHGLIGA